MGKISIRDEAHWHEERANNVGASEVAALFGASPYTTRFTLWHEKSGKLACPDFDCERVEWGTILEPVIAKALAERQGWTIQKVHRYLTHPSVKRMGASLDYEILNHPNGPGCFEVKNVSIEAWKRSWSKNEDGSIEAPLHIELQLQHQMSVTGRKWGAFGVLVGGNEGHVIIRTRHEPTIAKIEKAVAEFWESIAMGEAPGIESGGDLAAITEIFEGAETVELETHAFENAVKDYQVAQRAAKSAEGDLDAAKARLIEMLAKHKAQIAIGRGFKVSYKEQSRKEFVAKATKFRVLRVSEMKGDE